MPLPLLVDFSFKDKFINMPDETCDFFCHPRKQGSRKLPASNVVIFLTGGGSYRSSYTSQQTSTGGGVDPFTGTND